MCNDTNLYQKKDKINYAFLSMETHCNFFLVKSEW